MLSVKEREFLRKQISELRVNEKNISTKEIVRRFKSIGIAQNTIYSMIKKLDRDKSNLDMKRTGRPSTWTKVKLAKLGKKAKNQVGTSQNKLAALFKVHQSTICRTLAKKNIHYRKRTKCPQYTEAQLEKIPRLCRLLLRNYFHADIFVVMDDEKYFYLKCDETPGNRGFYTDNYKETPDDVKFASKKKYPTKIMVWVAISKKGISEAFIIETAGETINQWNHLKECVKKRLQAFINKHHSDGKYVFWPDLASAHYADSVVAYYDENLNYVAKVDNPPNVPQARPIETFWAILQQQVYEDGWQTDDKHLLALRIKQKLRNFDVNLVQTLMEPVRTKLRKIADKGPLAAL